MDPAFEALLEYLKRERGVRLHRLQARQPDPPRASGGCRWCGSPALRATTSTTCEVHPDEFTALFNTILINVTGFFRDPEAWDGRCASDVLPALLARAAHGSRSACGAPAAPRARRPTPWPCCWPRRWASSGFRQRVKIYATDVDEEALAQARQASYSRRDLEGVPAGAAGAVLRAARRRPLRLPQGPAALRDLRPPRPDPGRADLAHRPADLPQHPDVLQRRDPGADPRRGSTSRCSRRGVLFLGKAETLLSHASTVQARRPEAPHLHARSPSDAPASGRLLAFLPAPARDRDADAPAGCAREAPSRPARWRSSSSTADGLLVAGQPSGPARCSA